MNHIVLGANGSIGRALVARLAEQKLTTLAISRSVVTNPLPHVDYAQVDIVQHAEFGKLIPNNSIVYYAVNAPYHRWKDDLEPMLDAAIAACRGRDIRFVYIDNVYAYGAHESILRETVNYNPTTQKGKLRARLANKIMQEHKAGTLEVTIARASDIYGPAVKWATLGELTVTNLFKSGNASVPVAVNMPHCFNYVNDLAANIITLALSEEAWGEIWHIPCDKPISIAAWGDIFVKYLGKAGAITTMPSFLEKILGLFVAPLREYREMQYEYEQVFELNADKYLKHFDAVVTPHEQAIQNTIDWYGEALATEKYKAAEKASAKIKPETTNA